MHDKTAKKLARRDCDAFAVFGTESNRLARYGHNTAITDSDTMSVPAEVAQDVDRVGEGLFDIYQPVDFGQFLHQPIKRLRVGEIVESVEGATGVQRVEYFCHLGAK